jgi:hypothetical protein
MLSLLTMLTLKSMCWGLISLNLHTIPCLLLVYCSAYFVAKPNSLANHYLLHIIFWHKLCLFCKTLIFVKACFISCLLDIHRHFIKLLKELISIDDVFPFNNVWPRAKFVLCLWHVCKAWAKNVVKNFQQQKTKQKYYLLWVDNVFKSLSTGSWSCFVGAITNRHHGNQIPQTHLDSLNILKTIRRIRWKCGVLVIATFHMQGRTLMQLWNHSIATRNESSCHLENGLLDINWIG